MTDLDLDVRWYTGTQTRRGHAAPPIQVHRAAEHTVILRQSIADNYEAPFLYLLFGEDRAVVDTGATADATRFPLRETVDALIDGWLVDHPHPAYDSSSPIPMPTAITSPGTDSSPMARTPAWSVTPPTTSPIFGIKDWPQGSAQFDLGGRAVDMIPSPGHHPSAVTVYDPATAVLLTGDTVYPGRLYVGDFPAFQATLRTLCAFSAAHPVAAVLGAHIEMSGRPFRDFPLGSTLHPNEAPLPLTTQDLNAVRVAAARVADRPGAHRFSNFIIWNGPCRREAAAQFGRLWLSRIFRR